MKKRKGSGQPESKTALAKPESDTKRAVVKQIAPGTLKITLQKSLDDLIDDICTPTGTQHEEIAIRIIDQVGMSLVCPKPNDRDSQLLQAIGTIAALAPQNTTEAMLATQMIAVHEAAMMFMVHATSDNQTFQGRDANVLRATRLMRLHLDQIEAMQKLKGKAGQQKVIVEHVHVHEGGQAIVGAVAPTAPGRGVGDDTGNR
jgi:hypothetical protein